MNRMTKKKIYSKPSLLSTIEGVLKDNGKTLKDIDFVCNEFEGYAPDYCSMEADEFIRLAKDIHYDTTYNNGQAFDDIVIALKNGDTIRRIDDIAANGEGDWFRYFAAPHRSARKMEVDDIVWTNRANVWFKCEKISSNGEEEEE